MAERIEFVGNPLPTGLPGFGGGTVSVLTLPGFNAVVAVQQFGPVVNAPTVTLPTPTPPPGSNPENPTPTPTPVVPAPAPPPPTSGTSRGSFCERCVPPEFNIANFPLMMAIPAPSGCLNCQGLSPGTVAQPEVAANSENQGIFWDGNSGIIGKEPGGKEWSITEIELTLDGDSGGVTLNESQLALGVGGGVETFYQAGPTIQGPNGETYSPQNLNVCEGGQTVTWKVLAYVP